MKTNEKLHPSLNEVQLGVWRIVYTRPASFVLSGRHPLGQLKKAHHYTRTYLIPFFRDVWLVLGARLFLLFILDQIWMGIRGALKLYLLNALLKEIESSLIAGQENAWAISRVLVIRLGCVCAEGMTRWLQYSPIMRTRIKLHFRKVIMRAHLRLDLPTYSNAANRPNIKGSRTWNVFHDLVRSTSVVSSLLSHVALILELARGERGGFFFAILCVSKPIYMYITKDDLWSNKFIAYATNPNFLRSRDLLSLAIEQKYKQEVLSGSLEGYIIKEFDKAHIALKGTSDEFPAEAYRASRPPLVGICTSLLGDLPLMYYAVNAIMSPETLSISALAIHQQTVVSIQSAITRVTQQGSSINKNLNHIKSLYDGLNVQNSIPDGRISYPDSELPTKKGMAISVRNVLFQYQGPSNTRFALKNVSFDIPASSLVVIVGANGSGKSSLVNLLTRLHYPTSGTILIDGKPMNEYRSRDLRKAVALLTQDHVLFPISVGENIAIGDPGCEDGPEKHERIQAAARLGGAAEVIRKLDQGLEEMTEREETLCSSPFPLPPGPLKDIAEKVERYTEFSGGEIQRLAASRTFMRISSGKVKLVVADEPTSAMDPEGEFELFEALRKVQDSMTTIFITHRFGHLTKYADLILCLKDGELVESGTHHELIAHDGEYSKLYKIQASAFAEVCSHLGRRGCTD